MSRTAACEWDGLIERNAIQESEARFGLLVKRQSRFVFRVAYVVLRSAVDSEDVVQDVFFKLFRTGSWK
ncbi:MAG TPA: sigma factor [Bryobacteraceae bacterium]|nr:sigma factor [Bryobacteraceae bacterium]